MCIKLLTWGQQITFPTRPAKGAEQSDAVFSIILEIEEKFTGHFPVKIGSYVLGKEGYMGGSGSTGYGFRGITAGEISIGLKRPIGGSDSTNLSGA